MLTSTSIEMIIYTFCQPCPILFCNFKGYFIPLIVTLGEVSIILIPNGFLLLMMCNGLAVISAWKFWQNYSAQQSG